METDSLYDQGDVELNVAKMLYALDYKKIHIPITTTLCTSKVILELPKSWDKT